MIGADHGFARVRHDHVRLAQLHEDEAAFEVVPSWDWVIFHDRDASRASAATQAPRQLRLGARAKRQPGWCSLLPRDRSLEHRVVSKRVGCQSTGQLEPQGTERVARLANICRALFAAKESHLVLPCRGLRGRCARNTEHNAGNDGAQRHDCPTDFTDTHQRRQIRTKEATMQSAVIGRDDK